MMHNFENGILTIVNEDGGILTYPYNPETQVPWNSEEEALAYAYSRPMYFVKPLSEEELRKLSTPKSITDLQARLLLIRLGKLKDVEAIAEQDPVFKAWFDRALVWERDDTYVIQAATLLGIIDKQLDAMFIEASKL